MTRPQLRGEDVATTSSTTGGTHIHNATLNTWWQQKCDLERELDALANIEAQRDDTLRTIHASWGKGGAR